MDNLKVSEEFIQNASADQLLDVKMEIDDLISQIDELIDLCDENLD